MVCSPFFQQLGFTIDNSFFVVCLIDLSVGATQYQMIGRLMGKKGFGPSLTEVCSWYLPGGTE
jgi:hypothetical protein